jgi:hypothetical protein
VQVRHEEEQIAIGTPSLLLIIFPGIERLLLRAHVLRAVSNNALILNHSFILFISNWYADTIRKVKREGDGTAEIEEMKLMEKHFTRVGKEKAQSGYAYKDLTEHVIYTGTADSHCWQRGVWVLLR